MARYRGTVKGMRGEASRLGGPGKGLHVTAATWAVRVSVDIWADSNDNDRVEIEAVSLQGSERRVLYRGQLSELLKEVPDAEES